MRWGGEIREGVLIEMSRVFTGEVLMIIKKMREPGGWKPDSLTEISEVRGRGAWVMGGGSFIGDEVGRVGVGVGVEDGYCESTVGDDEEENCEFLLGKFDEEEEGEKEEEEEEDDERISDNHHIKNKHIDLSQASRESADAPHQ